MRRSLLTCVGAWLALMAPAGCGSSASGGGIASRAPETILRQSLAAANSLNSVHATGAITSGGQHIRLDMTLVNGVGGKGQITLNGSTFRLVGINRYAYLQAPPSVWQKAGAPASAAKLLQGKWLRAPATGQFDAVAKLTDIHQLFNQLLTQHGQHLKNAGTTTVAGRKVVAVVARNGRLYVATRGKPYPIRLTNTGSSAGQLDFDRFDQPVTLAAPTNTVDLPQVSG